MDDGNLASAVLTNDTQHARIPSLVHANKHMGTLHATLKRECEELVTLTDQVKLWISLTMPKCVVLLISSPFRLIYPFVELRGALLLVVLSLTHPA